MRLGLNLQGQWLYKYFREFQETFLHSRMPQLASTAPFYLEQNELQVDFKYHT